MKIITGTVEGQNVVIDKSVLAIQGTVGVYALKLAYDDETWGTIDTKIITFTNGVRHIAVEDTGAEEGVEIPWEVLQASPKTTGFIAIGVIGYEGTTIKLTTTSIYKRNQLIVLPEVLGLSSAMTPTPDIYQKLTQGLIAAQEAVTQTNDKIGNLASLDTEDKTNLVAAINEVLRTAGVTEITDGTGETLTGVVPLKTINNQSILGPGNIDIKSGGATATVEDTTLVFANDSGVAVIDTTLIIGEE